MQESNNNCICLYFKEAGRYFKNIFKKTQPEPIAQINETCMIIIPRKVDWKDIIPNKKLKTHRNMPVIEDLSLLKNYYLFNNNEIIKTYIKESSQEDSSLELVVRTGMEENISIVEVEAEKTTNFKKCLNLFKELEKLNYTGNFKNERIIKKGADSKFCNNYTKMVNVIVSRKKQETHCKKVEAAEKPIKIAESSNNSTELLNKDSGNSIIQIDEKESKDVIKASNTIQPGDDGNVEINREPINRHKFYLKKKRAIRYKNK